MACDEAPQAAAQPILLIGDDGGVRNGQAKRAAEQRGDREPIRDPANQPRLGGGLQQISPIARRQAIAEQNEPGHRHQQTSREGAMALERQAKSSIPIMIRHEACIARKTQAREALWDGHSTLMEASRSNLRSSSVAGVISAMKASGGPGRGGTPSFVSHSRMAGCFSTS